MKTQIAKMKTASTLSLVLANAIAGGVSSQQVLRDIPVVGVGPTSQFLLFTSQAEPTTNDDQEELITALEFDDHVTGKKMFCLLYTSDAADE